MSTIGERLAEERKRLGYNQTDFAEIGGIKRASQVNYETNRRSPDSEYWEGIAKIGVDVQYILTGIRSANLYQVAEERADYGVPPSKSPKPHPVDPVVHAGVLAAVEEYLEEQQSTMSSDAKSELVLLLCDLFTPEAAKDKAATKAAVAKIIRLKTGSG